MQRICGGDATMRNIHAGRHVAMCTTTAFVTMFQKQHSCSILSLLIAANKGVCHDNACSPRLFCGQLLHMALA